MNKIKQKFLGLSFKIKSVFRRKKLPSHEKIKKILVAANMGLGNMLFFTPVIQNLKLKYPKVQLILLKGDNQPIDQIFEDEFQDILSLNLYAPSFSNIFQTIWKLRQMKIDLAFCNFISATFYLNFVLGFANIETIIGHGTSPGYYNNYDLIYDISVPVSKSEHEIDRNLNLLTYADLPVSERKMSLKLNETELQKADQLIIDHQLKQHSPLIGIAPGSFADGWWKRWDKKRYVDLIKKIIHKYSKSAFIILGGEDEVEVSDFILEELNRFPVISFVNQTSVKQLVALISRCDLIIGNDTGPVHIASALNRPAICIWGPSYIQRAHLRHEKGINIWKNLPCSPCYTESGTDKVLSCDNRLCLSTITVEEVFQSVEQLISNKNFDD